MKKQILLLTIALSSVLCLWHCNALKTVPDELIGTWRAKTPDYKGAFIRLQRDSITFGTIEGDVQVCSIIKIKKNKEEGEWKLFTIYYLDNNSNRCELPVYFHPIDHGILRFKNKEEVTLTRENT